jgi:hypothetical protein
VTSVEVAVLNTGEAAYDVPADFLRESSPETPWSSRAFRSLEVEDETPIPEIVDAAAAQLGIVAKRTWWARDLLLSEAAPPLWFPDVRDQSSITRWTAYVDSAGAARCGSAIMG